MTNSKMAVLNEIRRWLEQDDTDALREMVRVMAELFMGADGVSAGGRCAGAPRPRALGDEIYQ